jgi:cell division protein FtsA
MGKKEQIISAIDIGTTKIVAIIAKKDESGKYDILGLGKSLSNGVKRGVVVNIEDTVAAIESAKGEAEEKAGYKMHNVYVGIAGQHIKSMKNRNRKYIDGEEITQEDVDYLSDQMLRTPIDPGDEILHVIPQSYIVDNEVDISRPVGISGRVLEGNFHLVIGQVASAKNITKCVERVGLNVIRLILEPLASATAVLADDEKEAGVALIDIGGGTTDIAIYNNNVVSHTAVIPYGGNVITNDIKEGCSILLRHAEALKIQFGSAMGDTAPADKMVTIPGISGRDPKEISFKNLAYIIQARMEEIIDSIVFEIDNSGCREKLSAGIVITGGGALLKDLPQLIGFKTGYDVRVGYPNRYLVPGVSKNINQPMYATSIGLAIEGGPTGAGTSRNFFATMKKNQGSGLKEKVRDNWDKFFSEENSKF